MQLIGVNFVDSIKYTLLYQMHVAHVYLNGMAIEIVLLVQQAFNY